MILNELRLSNFCLYRDEQVFDLAPARRKQTALETLNTRLKALEDKGVSGAVPLDAREGLKEEIKDAESGVEKAHRKAIKAKVKADDAAKTIDALNPGLKSAKEPSK